MQRLASTVALGLFSVMEALLVLEAEAIQWADGSFGGRPGCVLGRRELMFVFTCTFMVSIL
jgi:hypothetical protein